MMALRWTPLRKAALVARLEAGAPLAVLSEESGVAPEEILAWAERFARFGPSGLKLCDLGEVRRIERLKGELA